jgi:hypothetical protein
MNKLFAFLLLNFVLYIPVSYSQIYGCTDPLANNYNNAATVNNGSCTYNPVSIGPMSVANLPATLKETSGLIYWNNRLWTHNDDADINLYAFHPDSVTQLHNYPITGTANKDWEEIAQDSLYVYIGDFGNNANGNRTDLKILRIEKNALLSNNIIADTIQFTYSNQSDFTPAGSNKTDFDCEAFIITEDSIFLFTKQWNSRKTSVYALPKIPGNHTAQLKSTYNVNGLITGAVCLETKRLIVLCGYTALLQPFFYLLYDFREHNFFDGNKRMLSFAQGFHQTEAITTSDGLKYYVTNENLVVPPLINNPQKLFTVNLAPFLNNYLNNFITLTDFSESSKPVVYPVPTAGLLHLELLPEWVGKNYSIADIQGKTVHTGAFITANTDIELSDFASGIYYIRIDDSNQTVIKVVKQ